jgi:hypothetical protein
VKELSGLCPHFLTSSTYSADNSFTFSQYPSLVEISISLFRRERMKKARFWIVLVAAVLLAGAGYLAYTRWFATPAVEETPPLQTATVRSGDMVITASGSGALMPAAELDLAFDRRTVAEVMVKWAMKSGRPGAGAAGRYVGRLQLVRRSRPCSAQTRLEVTAAQRVGAGAHRPIMLRPLRR